MVFWQIKMLGDFINDCPLKFALEFALSLLLFSQFTGMLDLLARDRDSLKIEFLKLAGKGPNLSADQPTCSAVANSLRLHWKI